MMTNNLPARRRALICSSLEGPSQLTIEEQTLSAPKEDEVCIEVRAGGLNFPDLLMTQGKYQLKPQLPFTPGMEACGTIIACGRAVNDFAPGDRVSVRMRVGAFADYITLPASEVVPAPPAFDDSETACYMTSLHTARHCLIDRAQLTAGERVLVLGASGGVGYACSQLALHIGAEVMVGASSAEKLRMLEPLGAQHSLNYGHDELIAAVRAVWPDGPDVIIDPVGGDLFEQAVRLPRWGGRLLVVGFASGRIGQVPANLPLIKGYSIIGVRAGEATRRDPELAATSKHQIKEWTDAGLMRPLIGARFAFADAIDAFKMMADRKAIGRIAIEFNRPNEPAS